MCIYIYTYLIEGCYKTARRISLDSRLLHAFRWYRASTTCNANPCLPASICTLTHTTRRYTSMHASTCALQSIVLYNLVGIAGATRQHRYISDVSKIDIYIYICTHTLLYFYIHIYIYRERGIMYTYICMYIYIYIYIEREREYAYIYIYIYMYIYIYIERERYLS